MQRFVYVMAKNEHTEDPNQNASPPSGMGRAQDFRNATSKFR